MECDCGSGLQREEQKDAMGIFLCYTCPKCEKEKLSQYDPSVFDAQAYQERASEFGESIDEDY